jgi:hypothetical protein
MRCMQIAMTGLALATALAARADSRTRQGGIEHVVAARATGQSITSTDVLKDAEVELVDAIGLLQLEPAQAAQVEQDVRELVGVVAAASLSGERLVDQPSEVLQGREPSGFLLGRMADLGVKDPSELPQADLLLELKAPERLAGLMLDDVETTRLMLAASRWMEAAADDPDAVIPMSVEVQP